MLRFGRPRLRPLPWRATRDPWAVLVSEVMLQQTQAPRVVDAYGAFLRRFPTPEACARAGLGSVITAWAGLGYNRRARHLHAAATAIVERHGGRVPDDLGALHALPGVGDYTARAVRVFAYERCEAVVDVNVQRVLSRAAVGAPLSRRDAQTAGRRARAAPLAMGVEPGAHRDRRRPVHGSKPGVRPLPVGPVLRVVHCRRREPIPRPAPRRLVASRVRTAKVGADSWPPCAPGPCPGDGSATPVAGRTTRRRARRVALDLVAEGLAQRDADGTLALP